MVEKEERLKADDNNDDDDDDESDFIELCPDTSEFAEDESLVKEITANLNAAETQGSSSLPATTGRTTAIRSSVMPASASDNSSDESEDEGAGRSRRSRLRGRDAEQKGVAESALGGDTESLDETKAVASSTKKRPAPSDVNIKPNAIHINKHFRGTVQALPGTCLAWDAGQMNGLLGRQPPPSSLTGRMAPPSSLTGRVAPPPFSGFNPQFRTPFRGLNPGNFHGSPIHAGVPFLAVPPFRPVPQFNPMQAAAQILQERFLGAGAFGGLPAAGGPMMRAAQPTARGRPYFLAKPNQHRPPNF
ncbi:hypothetical protein BV898_10729 [Hypsibius exemplaris]|uniref:Uncharacterized protein n=1 Tax=Hypsibius exemplaris TaxID=2072580 RepID=A0A1W0WIR1_HYPEX|nr:hypothetical protein BV898_10729 [Hypsibius exemplaris]